MTEVSPTPEGPNERSQLPHDQLGEGENCNGSDLNWFVLRAAEPLVIELPIGPVLAKLCHSNVDSPA
jgi:hypothetical protein